MKVLVTASHFDTLCVEAKKLLEEKGFEVVTGGDMPYLPAEELIKIIGDIDAAIVGMDQWNKDVFEAAKKLKVIARFGVGVDNIDLAAAKEKGIVVVNARGLNSNAVAETTMALLLNILRSMPTLVETLKNDGAWMRSIGYDLEGKTVGLLGFGDIARRLAKKLVGFDAKVIAYDPYPNNEVAEKLGVTLTTQDEVLANADIISVHIPSTPETKHFINAETLGKMKKGVFFINTARGALVDTEALCDAVISGHVAGAGLDVFESEPLPKDARVLGVKNIVCTPHTAAETYETYRNTSLFCAKAVLDVMDGREPENWINK